MTSKQGKGVWRILAGAAALALVAPLATAPARADEEQAPVSSSAYRDGFRSFHAGDYRTARIQLLNALKADENNALARIMLARTSLALGNGVEAQTQLERAAAAGADAGRLRHLRAHALLLQGDKAQAEELLAPGDIEPQFAAYAARLRGQIAASDLNFDEAEREYNRALALAPNDPEISTIVARFLTSLSRFEPARELLADVLAVRPGYVDALVAMGDVVRRTEGLEPSLPYFSRALEVDRNDISALLERAATYGDLQQADKARADLGRVNQLVKQHPMALYLEAVLETREGDTDRARELMGETRGLVDAFPPAMMLQGLLALDAGNYETATEYLGTLVGRVPNSITARKLYASAQLQRGDAEGAFATVKPIIDADAADARVFALAGAAKARSGDSREAQRYLSQAEQLSGDASVQNQLAMTQLLGGQPELAEQTVREVLSEDDDSLAGLMMLTPIRLQDGKFAEAEQVSRRIIRAHADLPIGYNLRGGALLGQNKRDAAEASFRQALQRDGDYDEARRNLAQLLVAKGDVKGARAELRKVVSNNNEDVRALTMLGEIAGSRGERDEQIQWLQQAASVNSAAAAPRIALAEAYLASGAENRAQNEANALLRDFPQDANALLAAARIYEATGRQAQLVSLFDRMVSVEPNRLLPRVLLGRALQATGKVDDARRTFQRALTITAEDTTPAYLELIALEAREGRLEQAREWAVRLRNQKPNSNIAENALGRAYLLADRPQDALQAFSTARGKTFDAATARGIADAYVKLGRQSDAIKVLQDYRKANPDDPASLASIAELQLNAGQYRQSAANYEALRKSVGSRDPAILNNLAYAYLKIGDKRAVTAARMAYNLAPQNAAIADTYGWALLKTDGDKKRALSLLRRASSTLPRNGEIRYHLAQAYLSNGQRSEALKEVREAIRLDDDFAERQNAQQLLRRLGG